jgi:hypothetical protein
MGHILGMNSRVHPKYKTKYRVSNWAEYDRGLVQRGDITLWLSAGAAATWKPASSRKRGGQRKFSDQAIETALMLRLVFKLPLRQAEGFLRSVLSLMGVNLEAPDHTTLSRRGQQLSVDLHLVASNEPIHLIVDSTGLSIVGEGEWAAAKHGGRGKRAWKKLHLGVDRSGSIVAEVLTDGNADDSWTALDLITEVDGKSADSRQSDDLGIRGLSSLRDAPRGRVLEEGVDSVFVAVVDVLTEKALEVPLVDHDHVVQ